MASDPRRRGSRGLPPNLSELMNKFTEHAESFKKEFRTKRPEMKEIVEEFKKIADEVRQMQERTDKARKTGAVTGGIGLAVGILAAPFTGGLSLAGAAAAAAAGATAAVAGTAVVVGANITKMMKEDGSAEKVEKFGKEFMKIVEPMKNDLEEIKMTCGKMEQIKTKDEASSTLSDVEKFGTILSRVSELARRSNEALIVAVAVMEVMRDLVMLIVGVLRVTATPEEDKKLRDAIIQSADQLKEVILKFDRMAEELKAVIEK